MWAIARSKRYGFCWVMWQPCVVKRGKVHCFMPSEAMLVDRNITAEWSGVLPLGPESYQYEEV
jgi:hypothetical protein